MATNTNNGGASSMYYHGDGRGQTDEEQDKKIVAIVFPVIIVVILVLRLLCSCLQKDSEEQDAGGPGNTAPQLRPSRERTEAGGRVVDRAPSSTVAGAGAVVEVAVAQAGEPPLVCTYMKADGWGEGTCGVCLADLADGDALRVLPACMHYFHAACVGEWLRAHGTCPLCRAPLVAPAAAA